MIVDEKEEAIVKCATTKGPIVMRFVRSWSPHGYDRAVTLFDKGFFDHSHFFRVVPDFLVQFGISYSSDEELKHWANEEISDDPQLDPPIPFEGGTIAFAGSGDNSRTSQLFIAYAKSESLGTQKWETPVGKVTEGMEHVKAFYSYGDMPPWGKGPVQGKIHSGRAYIDENFPLTDSFETCSVERVGSATAKKAATSNEKNNAPKSASSYFQTAEGGPTAIDVKLVAGGVLLVVIIWVFARSLLGSKKQAEKTS